MSKRTYFSKGSTVEFCPVATRQTSLVKWRPATYVDEHRGLGAGWHLVREPSGNIVSVPTRRLRALGGSP